MSDANISITKQELERIRALGDFDLEMLLSEIHDFGWVNGKHPTIGGKALLPMIWEAHLKRRAN
jgi:hypothetical protein